MKSILLLSLFLAPLVHADEWRPALSGAVGLVARDPNCKGDGEANTRACFALGRAKCKCPNGNIFRVEHAAILRSSGWGVIGELYGDCSGSISLNPNAPLSRFKTHLYGTPVGFKSACEELAKNEKEIIEEEKREEKRNRKLHPPAPKLTNADAEKILSRSSSGDGLTESGDEEGADKAPLQDKTQIHEGEDLLAHLPPPPRQLGLGTGSWHPVKGKRNRAPELDDAVRCMAKAEGDEYDVRLGAPLERRIRVPAGARGRIVGVGTRMDSWLVEVVWTEPILFGKVHGLPHFLGLALSDYFFGGSVVRLAIAEYQAKDLLVLSRH